ncbi:hypothetical protein DdX_13176 [Ditylenchus destructor]|uniref:Uncharacterized protein n=1 Tax=Ditylenchus destructor TaxID=166010 RepID=A0AAD4MX64_9BILA|nr:hypothetical protein DdX_13176 [Ditylenchus destructor]
MAKIALALLLVVILHSAASRTINGYRQKNLVVDDTGKAQVVYDEPMPVFVPDSGNVTKEAIANSIGSIPSLAWTVQESLSAEPKNEFVASELKAVYVKYVQ